MKVLVIGATGKQGGHVAQLLLKKGHQVVGLTRHTDAPHAKELTQLGAKMVTGDFNDPKSIERAAEGVDAIFTMTTPYEEGADVELKHGMTVVDVAKATGKYLVFTSVASADQNTGISFFDSKYKIEQYIKKSKIEAAIIAPVYFMENAISWGTDALKEGSLRSPLPADLKLQQIALDDIAGFAVLALENKERFLGKRIDIASDVVTGKQAAEILSRAIGKPIKYKQLSREESSSNMPPDVVKMFDWFEKVGYHVDIAALKREYPEVKWHTYESWAKEQKWDAILGVAAAGRR